MAGSSSRRRRVLAQFRKAHAGNGVVQLISVELVARAFVGTKIEKVFGEFVPKAAREGAR